MNDVLSKLDETFFENMSVDQIWVKICNESNFLQLFQIISKVLSIPVSNAGERNKMRVNLVRAELCTKLNFKMTCQEFADYLSKDEQKIVTEMLSVQ